MQISFSIVQMFKQVLPNHFITYWNDLLNTWIYLIFAGRGGIYPTWRGAGRTSSQGIYEKLSHILRIDQTQIWMILIFFTFHIEWLLTIWVVSLCVESWSEVCVHLMWRSHLAHPGRQREGRHQDSWHQAWGKKYDKYWTVLIYEIDLEAVHL